MTSRGTIVWIDDDDDLIAPQKESLESIGFHVQIMADVDQAVALLRSKRGDLCGVIIDVMMDPGEALRVLEHDAGLRTGLVLCQMLRREGLCPPPRVFIFTHRNDPKAAAQFRGMGIGYFKKQHYKGAAICDLVERQFGSEPANETED